MYMKRLLILFLLSSTFCFSQNQDFKPLDSLLDQLYSHDQLMGSMTISKDGNEVYSKSVGYQYITEKEKKKATSASKYRIGSITKTFTAVMIFQLVDENKIALDNKLSKYYPEIPNASKISLANLLNHSSGLYNITSDPNIEHWVYRPSTEKEMVSRIASHEVDFQPSEKTSYSNTNYILLGYILEQIEGKPYQMLLKERIVDKLGLKNTYFGGSIDIGDNECSSYIYDEDNNNNALVEASQEDLSNAGGAGGIVSNTSDLTTFMTELFNNKLITKESLKLMTTVSDKGICYGVLFGKMKGMDIYASEGTIDRFQSFLMYVPKTKTAIAITANALDYSKLAIMLKALSISQNIDVSLQDIPKN